MDSKKILFIDLFCDFGHNNINKIYVKEFLSSGYDVHIAMKKSYFESLGVDNKLLRLELPERLFEDSRSKVLYRFQQVRLLRYILSKTKSFEYSFYFFSFFDEIAFYASGFNRPAYLMVHGNTESLFSPVKCFFLKRLSKNSQVKFVVFLEIFKKLFNSRGINNVLVSSHGLPLFVNEDANNVNYSCDDLLRTINCSYIEPRIIFVPNANKFGDSSINDLIKHQPFLELIERKNIIVVMKGEPSSEPLDRFFYLAPYVDNRYLKALLINSFVVLLNYPSSFQYRVSGFFFECMAYNVPLLITNIASFVHYSNNFNYNPYYNNLHELVSAVDFLSNVNRNFRPYKELHTIEPSLKEIF
jgi:hypothetical protein